MVPVILAALGVVAGGKGVVDTVQGISKIKDANETKNLAEIRHKNNINKLNIILKNEYLKINKNLIKINKKGEF